MKPVFGFPDYFIDERANVFSAKNGGFRMVSPRIGPTGYVRFGLMREGRQVWRFAHRLLWQSYVEDIPEGLVINHKNGIKHDNRIENLEVVTISENTKHSFRVLGNKPCINPSPGEKNGLAKLTDAQVMAIREHRKATNDPYRKMQQIFGLSLSTIHRACVGKTWKHL